MNLVPGSTSSTTLHTGAAVWTYLDSTRVLRIAGSPFAARPDAREKNTWLVFMIESRRIVAWTRGDRHDARTRLIETERDYLTRP